MIAYTPASIDTPDATFEITENTILYITSGKQSICLTRSEIDALRRFLNRQLVRK